MAKYQRILYDYARPTWRWDGNERKNEEKRLRRLKDEALANSKNKQTLFNTRRAYAKNRNLDLSLETNVLFLSKYYGERCNDIEINQHAIGKNQRKKNLRKNGPGGGAEKEEGRCGRGEVGEDRGGDLVKEKAENGANKRKDRKHRGKGGGKRQDTEQVRQNVPKVMTNETDVPSPSCSLPGIRLPPPEPVPTLIPSSSAAESSRKKLESTTTVDHLPRIRPHPHLEQQLQHWYEDTNDSEFIKKTVALPSITPSKTHPNHQTNHQSITELLETSKPNGPDKPGYLNSILPEETIKEGDEQHGDDKPSWKLGGWKPRTPNSTKYFIYRHYYEPESVFSSNTTQSTNMFRSVGKVDLLQAKRKPNNTLSTPKVVSTTKYV